MKRSILSAALCLFVGGPAAVFGQGLYPWDCAALGQAGQTTAFMSKPFGGFCGLPVEMGDYDDDGYPDYAVAPMNAAGGPAANRTESGEIVVFKGNGTIGGILNDAALPVGQPLLRIYGGASFDYAGTELYSADVTGDGKIDLIIASSGADPLGRNLAGSVYVLPGGVANFNGATIDLASPPSWVKAFHGKDTNDRFGVWVEAGDINGDGIKDILVGADDGNGPTNAVNDKGEVYVIWGGQTFPATVDLASPPPGFGSLIVYGVDMNDHLGTTLHAVDLDADGYEELIMAAAINRAGAANTGQAVAGGDGPGNMRSNCGDTYIVWGRAAFPATIDLAAPDTTTAAALTIVYGADAGDVLGEELSSGDFDGDGYPDLVLGALTSYGYQNAITYAGEALILYGGPALRGQIVDAQNPPANAAIIYGAAPFDIAGDTLSAGDVNKDGFDDLLFGVPEFDAPKPSGTVTDAGAIVIFFGGPVRWGGSWVIDNIPTRIPYRTIWGADPGDLQGYSMECGDMDLDGFEDPFPNSMRGDGFNNTSFDCGEVNIVSGRIFCKGLATLADLPQIGTSFAVSARAEPGFACYGLFSLALGPGIPVPGAGTVNLANDFLLQLSITPGQPYFSNMVSLLDAEGKGSYGMNVPAIPSLAGVAIFTSFVTINPANAAIGTIADTVSFVLVP